MFDAKSLLEMMVRGAGSPQAQGGQGGGQGGLGDLLGQLLGGANPQQQPAPQQGGGSGGLGLEDILRQFTGGQPQGAGPGSSAGGGGGGLEDLLRQFTGGQGGAPGGGQGGGLGDLLRNMVPSQSGGGAPGGGSPGGGLLDILGQILGQATSGVKDGAQRVDDATGASGQLRDILTRATGKSPEELMNQAKDLVEKNRMGAGVAAGGLGAVVLGTNTGRALVGSALKIGALALIGGLAYKAVQNYQAGKPVLGDRGQPQGLIEAPTGSGYEARAVTHDTALLYIRAMIAAAAADGRIDAREQEKIMGGLRQAGIDREAEEFLAQELNNPATTADLAAAVNGDAEAVQVFTAARIAVDVDNDQEHDFLVALANDLGLDQELVAHIDATARQAA